MNHIEELKVEIIKLEKAAEIGVELYKHDKNPDILDAAVFFQSEADMWKKILKEEYGIVVK